MYKFICANISKQRLTNSCKKLNETKKICQQTASTSKQQNLNENLDEVLDEDNNNGTKQTASRLKLQQNIPLESKVPSLRQKINQPIPKLKMKEVPKFYTGNFIIANPPTPSISKKYYHVYSINLSKNLFSTTSGYKRFATEESKENYKREMEQLSNIQRKKLDFHFKPLILPDKLPTSAAESWIKKRKNKTSKTDICYPTHTVKHNLTLTKRYRIREGSAETKVKELENKFKQRKKLQMKMFKTKRITYPTLMEQVMKKGKFNTISVQNKHPEKPPFQWHPLDELRIDIVKNMREENNLVPNDDAEKQFEDLIKSHPTIENASKEVKMKLKTKFVQLLLNSARKRAVTSSRSETNEKKSTKDDELISRKTAEECFEKVEKVPEIAEANAEVVTEDTKNVLTHPQLISSNNLLPKMESPNFKYPKGIWVDQSNNFDVNRVCIKETATKTGSGLITREYAKPNYEKLEEEVQELSKRVIKQKNEKCKFSENFLKNSKPNYQQVQVEAGELSKFIRRIKTNDEKKENNENLTNKIEELKRERLMYMKQLEELNVKLNTNNIKQKIDKIISYNQNNYGLEAMVSTQNKKEEKIDYQIKNLKIIEPKTIDLMPQLIQKETLDEVSKIDELNQRAKETEDIFIKHKQKQQEQKRHNEIKEDKRSSIQPRYDKMEDRLKEKVDIANKFKKKIENLEIDFKKPAPEKPKNNNQEETNNIKSGPNTLEEPSKYDELNDEAEKLIKQKKYHQPTKAYTVEQLNSKKKIQINKAEKIKENDFKHKNNQKVKRNLDEFYWRKKEEWGQLKMKEQIPEPGSKKTKKIKQDADNVANIALYPNQFISSSVMRKPETEIVILQDKSSKNELTELKKAETAIVDSKFPEKTLMSDSRTVLETKEKIDEMFKKITNLEVMVRHQQEKKAENMPRIRPPKPPMEDKNKKIKDIKGDPRPKGQKDIILPPKKTVASQSNNIENFAVKDMSVNNLELKETSVQSSSSQNAKLMESNSKIDDILLKNDAYFLKQINGPLRVIEDPQDDVEIPSEEGILKEIDGQHEEKLHKYFETKLCNDEATPVVAAEDFLNQVNKAKFNQTSENQAVDSTKKVVTSPKGTKHEAIIKKSSGERCVSCPPAQNKPQLICARTRTSTRASSCPPKDSNIKIGIREVKTKFSSWSLQKKHSEKNSSKDSPPKKLSLNNKILRNQFIKKSVKSSCLADNNLCQKNPLAILNVTLPNLHVKPSGESKKKMQTMKLPGRASETDVFDRSGNKVTKAGISTSPVTRTDERRNYPKPPKKDHLVENEQEQKSSDKKAIFEMQNDGEVSIIKKAEDIFAGKSTKLSIEPAIESSDADLTIKVQKMPEPQPEVQKMNEESIEDGLNEDLSLKQEYVNFNENALKRSFSDTPINKENDLKMSLIDLVENKVQPKHDEEKPRDVLQEEIMHLNRKYARILKGIEQKLAKKRRMLEEKAREIEQIKKIKNKSKETTKDNEERFINTTPKVASMLRIKKVKKINSNKEKRNIEAESHQTKKFLIDHIVLNRRSKTAEINETAKVLIEKSKSETLKPRKLNILNKNKRIAASNYAKFKIPRRPSLQALKLVESAKFKKSFAKTNKMVSKEALKSEIEAWTKNFNKNKRDGLKVNENEQNEIENTHKVVKKIQDGVTELLKMYPLRQKPVTVATETALKKKRNKEDIKRKENKSKLEEKSKLIEKRTRKDFVLHLNNRAANMLQKRKKDEVMLQTSQPSIGSATWSNKVQNDSSKRSFHNASNTEFNRDFNRLMTKKEYLQFKKLEAEEKEKRIFLLESGKKPVETELDKYAIKTDVYKMPNKKRGKLLRAVLKNKAPAQKKPLTELESYNIPVLTKKVKKFVEIEKLFIIKKMPLLVETDIEIYKRSSEEKDRKLIEKKETINYAAIKENIAKQNLISKKTVETEMEIYKNSKQKKDEMIELIFPKNKVAKEEKSKILSNTVKKIQSELELNNANLEEFKDKKIKQNFELNKKKQENLEDEKIKENLNKIKNALNAIKLPKSEENLAKLGSDIEKSVKNVTKIDKYNKIEFYKKIDKEIEAQKKQIPHTEPPKLTAEALNFKITKMAKLMIDDMKLKQEYIHPKNVTSEQIIAKDKVENINKKGSGKLKIVTSKEKVSKKALEQLKTDISKDNVSKKSSELNAMISKDAIEKKLSSKDSKQFKLVKPKEKSENVSYKTSKPDKVENVNKKPMEQPKTFISKENAENLNGNDLEQLKLVIGKEKLEKVSKKASGQLNEVISKDRVGKVSKKLLEQPKTVISKENAEKVRSASDLEKLKTVISKEKVDNFSKKASEQLKTVIPKKVVENISKESMEKLKISISNENAENLNGNESEQLKGVIRTEKLENASKKASGQLNAVISKDKVENVSKKLSEQAKTVPKRNAEKVSSADLEKLKTVISKEKVENVSKKLSEQPKIVISKENVEKLSSADLQKFKTVIEKEKQKKFGKKVSEQLKTLIPKENVNKKSTDQLKIDTSKGNAEKLDIEHSKQLEGIMPKVENVRKKTSEQIKTEIPKGKTENVSKKILGQVNVVIPKKTVENTSKESLEQPKTNISKENAEKLNSKNLEQLKSVITKQKLENVTKNNENVSKKASEQLKAWKKKQAENKKEETNKSEKNSVGFKDPKVDHNNNPVVKLRKSATINLLKKVDLKNPPENLSPNEELKKEPKKALKSVSQDNMIKPKKSSEAVKINVKKDKEEITPFIFKPNRCPTAKKNPKTKSSNIIKRKNYCKTIILPMTSLKLHNKDVFETKNETTLSKSVSDKIKIVPKEISDIEKKAWDQMKFFNSNKYKHLRISYMTVKRPKKNNEKFLSMQQKLEEQKLNEEERDKIINIRFELLKRLSEEFEKQMEQQEQAKNIETSKVKDVNKIAKKMNKRAIGNTNFFSKIIKKGKKNTKKNDNDKNNSPKGARHYSTDDCSDTKQNKTDIKKLISIKSKLATVSCANNEANDDSNELMQKIEAFDILKAVPEAFEAASSKLEKERHKNLYYRTNAWTYLNLHNYLHNQRVFSVDAEKKEKK